jgi:hypothetical protein
MQFQVRLQGMWYTNQHASTIIYPSSAQRSIHHERERVGTHPGIRSIAGQYQAHAAAPN